MASRPDRRTGPLRAVLVLVALLSVLLAACGSSDGASSDGAGSGEGGSSDQIQGQVRDDPLEVGQVSLPQVTADGKSTPFAFEAEKGDLLFVAFGYTNCPDVCPTTLSDIRTAKKQLGGDGDRVGVAFATVDPERDTDQVMNDYLGSFVDDGHPLRTTDPAALKQAQDAFQITSSVTKQPDGKVEVAHSARSFVVDDQGRVVVEWPFGTGAKTMASDLRLLLEQQGDS